MVHNLDSALAAVPLVNGEYKHFRELAELMTHGYQLLAGQDRYRFCELEFYFYSTRHTDPFVHQTPAQKGTASWCFHQRGGSYRGGTFKGLDISFGDKTLFGGILIRSLIHPSGTVVNGSSLVVDELMRVTGFSSLRRMDEALPRRVTAEGPLQIIPAPQQQPQPKLLTSARVGLSLKKWGLHSDMFYFFDLPYRFLTHPRDILKGRSQVIVSAHERGYDNDSISDLTGSTKETVRKYISAYQAGKQKDWEDSLSKLPRNGPNDCYLLGVVKRFKDWATKTNRIPQNLCTSSNTHTTRR